MEKVTISNLKIENYDGEDIVVRSGPAPDILQKSGVVVKGDITAPYRWIKGKSDAGVPVDPKTSHIKVDPSNGLITLIANESFEKLYDIIKGTISENPELSKFSINEHSHRTTPVSMKQLLKINRMYFDSKEENMRIVSDLEKFKVKASTEIQQSNDFKGNKKYLFEQSVEQELDLSFVLNMPIFKGGEKRKFKVDINFDIRDSAIEFWLESIELKEIQERDKENMLQDQAKQLSGYTLIYV